MGEFDRTGRRGPVSGRERVPCLPATVAVPRACAGTHEATRRAEGRWAARNGVERPFLSPVGCNGVSAAARHAGVGGQGATDAGKTPSARAGVLAREKKPRATRQAHCQRVSEADGRKTTLKSEFSKFAKEQCSSGVRQNVFGLWGFFLELIFGGVASHCSSRLPDFW